MTTTHITHKEALNAASDAYDAEVEAEAVFMDASDLYDRIGTDEAYAAMNAAEYAYDCAQRAAYDAEAVLDYFEG